MANESRTVSGTVSTSSEDSRYQVAMSLTRLIAGGEGEKKKDKDYWLDLYAECFHVVSYGNRK